MIIAYIRPDKHFEAVHEQLQLINSYTLTNNIVVDDEFIDQTSQDKRLINRANVTKYLSEKPNSILLIYDIWVLSSNVEDLIKMLSCLLKKNYTIHIIKQFVIISQNSSAILVLGLIDQLRQKIQNESKGTIGRPKGSKSNSKFDKHINKIICYIKKEESVNEIARLLNVSRSSLKDYIESRELKHVAFSSLLPKAPEDAEKQIINKINC